MNEEYKAKYMSIPVKLTEQELEDIMRYVIFYIEMSSPDFKSCGSDGAYLLHERLRCALTELLKMKKKAME